MAGLACLLGGRGMKWIFLLWGLSTVAWAGSPARIVSVGGAATETVFALGGGALVVGVDTSSVFPEQARTLPQVGYQRALAAEGIASLKPDFVILAATAGPPATIGQLEEIGVPLLRLQDGYSIDATLTRTKQIGKALGKIPQAEEICRQIGRDVSGITIDPQVSPRVLFVLSTGGGAPMVAGAGTAADAVIRLSGGKNAGEGFSGYKQLSPEALVALDPEVVVTTSRTMREAGTSPSSELLPGLGLTEAGKSGRLIVMDDLYLLGFGPRTGAALKELSQKLGECRPVAGR